MSSVNKVILLGHLGRDPEVRFSPDGKATCSLSLATSESWKDKATGERKEKSEWHRCVFFGKPADVLGEHAKKGGCLYVEGRLSTRKWQDKSGVDRYSTEIIGDQFQFVGAAPAGAAKPSADQSAAAYKAAKDGEAPPAAKKPDSGSLMDMDSDIPF